MEVKPKTMKDAFAHLTRAKQTSPVAQVKITPSTSVYTPPDFTQKLPLTSSKLFQQLTKRRAQLQCTSQLNRMSQDHKNVLEYKVAISNLSEFVTNFSSAYHSPQQAQEKEKETTNRTITLSSREHFQRWKEQNNFKYKKQILLQKNPNLFRAIL